MKSRKFLLACCLALVVAACGGEAADTTTSVADDGPTTTAADVTTTQGDSTTTSAVEETTTTASSGTSSSLAALQAAMRTSADAAPARVEGVMRMEGVAGGEGPEVVEMPFEMMLDAATGNSSMVMDFAAMAQMGGEEMPPEMADMMGSMEVRQIDDTVYLKFPFFTAFMGAETEWVSMPAEEGDDVTSGLGGSTAPSDPSTFLESFSEVEGTAEEIGPEDVRGIATTHYRVIVDQDWREHMSAEELAELEEQGPLPDAEFPLDLWIDGDGLVQRMAMTMTGEDLETDDEFQSMTMMFDFFDFGQSVTIEPPPADQVTDMEEMSGPFGGMTTPTSP